MKESVAVQRPEKAIKTVILTLTTFYDVLSLYDFDFENSDDMPFSKDHLAAAERIPWLAAQSSDHFRWIQCVCCIPSPPKR